MINKERILTILEVTGPATQEQIVQCPLYDDTIDLLESLTSLIRDGKVVQRDDEYWVNVRPVYVAETGPEVWPSPGTPAFDILQMVRHERGITAPEIRKRTGLSTSRAHIILDRLEAKGLIEISRFPDGNRCYAVLE